jgi:iron complex outermembrane receptor protein
MSTLTWDPSEHLTLRSLTQYRDNKYDVHGEFDGTWAPISEFAYLIRSKSESQEFQAVFDQGAFKGIAGLYLFNEKQNVYQFFYLGAIAADADLFLNGTGQTRAGAVFGDLTYSLTENFDVTLGGRYSYERRDATQDSSFDFGGIPVVTDMQRLPRLTFKAFTPKLVLKYQFDKDLNFYVSAQKGFRSGGYNVASLGDDAPFQPEKIWDFEGGVKTVLFDRRLDVNAALFYDKYTDLQLQDVIITTTVIRNAASAHIRGIDLDGQWRPFDRGVKFDYSVELLSAKFTQGKLTNPQHAERGLIQLDGRYLPRAPKISFTIGAEYTWDMPRAARLTATASGTYKSHQYFTEFNDPLVAQDSYWLLRAGLRYDFEKNWAVTFYGENLLNKYALTAGDPSSAAYGYQLQGAANPSRTLGLRLDYRL